MLKSSKKFLAASMACMLTLSVFAVSPARSVVSAASKAPVKFSMTYSDNATLPFKPDWLGIKEAEKIANAEIDFEVIPNTDYLQKISLMLNAGTAPDVVIYNTIRTGDMAAMALNGVFYPISEHPELTPNFIDRVEEYDMWEDVDAVKLSDGVRYYMPQLYDKPFYDAGVLIREDFLVDNDLEAPTTFDEFYEVMKAYKEEFPESYPLTNLVNPYVTFRMAMPSFGISVGHYASAGNYLSISYDYEEKEYFAAGIDERFRDFLRYFAMLYADGLYDPEFTPASGDTWTMKLATGAAMASYAYYDQIGGIETMSEIDGIKFNMLPPLEGPAGAHHQPKSRIGGGSSFPMTTAKRADFEDIVKAVDMMFYSEEAVKSWCLGVEGETYEMDGDKVVFNEQITTSADGIYKSMQLLYGLGTAPLQNVWVNEREMLKYDENYGEINKIVAAMDNAIQSIPPQPKLDDLSSEVAQLLIAPLYNSLDVWINDFITGKKDIEKDWDAYVEEMESKGINRLLEIYNDNL